MLGDRAERRGGTQQAEHGASEQQLEDLIVTERRFNLQEIQRLKGR